MLPLVKHLVGPIAVLGSTGFIGTNLVEYIKQHRQDVYGTTSRDMWKMLDDVRPQTVFNCISYGGYSYQAADSIIYHTNFILTDHILSWLKATGFHAYIHAGSSSEYGMSKAYPLEGSVLQPTTPYAISKAAASQLIYYYGKTLKERVCNLRLYHVYGPHEKHVRIVPTVIIDAIRHKKLPEFVRGDISRDFIYVEDVCRAFVTAAVNLKEENYGESFNIGTGKRTTISEVAELARSYFQITEPATFTMPEREWDTSECWLAQTHKAKTILGYEPKILFSDGFARTAEWFRGNLK